MYVLCLSRYARRVKGNEYMLSLLLFNCHKYLKHLFSMPLSNKLKIISMNCRGLGDTNKRKDVFGYLREKSASIYCIQDTHFTPSMEKIIRMQWGYEIDEM